MKLNLHAGRRLRATDIVDSWTKPNDGSRTLIESAMLPELAAALKTWQRAQVKNCVLIGGLAVSFYGKARMTQDCDFLFLSPESVPDQVPGFKRTRAHAFQHTATHIEIEVLDSEFLRVNQDLVDRIISTAVDHDGIKVASREGLICSKLSRFSRYDQADIEHLLQGYSPDALEAILAEIEDFPLDHEARKRLQSLV